MDWITDKLADAKTIVGLLFTIILGAIAIRQLIERKMISMILFLIAAGLMGWFVYDPQGATNTLTSLWK